MAESTEKVKVETDDKELLIFGYSRKILDESTMNVYPLDILNVIIHMYLNIILFGWDKEHHGDDIYFETKDDNTEILLFAWKHSRICLGDVVLDENTIKTAYWECELHSFNDDNKIDIYLGYVSHPITESIDNYNTWLGRHRKTKQFGICMSSDWKQFWCFGGNKYSTHGNMLYSSGNKEYEYKDGIHVGLKFDFVDKSCQLFYNGEKVNTILEDIPSKLIPAVCISRPSKVWCTKLEYQYK